MPRKTIKINESKLREMIAEAIASTLLENNFKSPYGKLWAAAHIKAKKSGGNPKEIFDDMVEKFNSRTAAVRDINADITKRRDEELPRDWKGFDNWENWRNREDLFYQAIKPELFDQDDIDNGIFGDNMDNFDSGRYFDDANQDAEDKYF